MGYNGAKSGPCYPILARSRSPKYELLMMHFLTEKTATPLIKRNSAHVVLNYLYRHQDCLMTAADKAPLRSRREGVVTPEIS